MEKNAELIKSLGELIHRHYKENNLAKKHKKIANEDNKEIKEIMGTLKLTEFEADGLIAKRIVSERVDLMQDVLLEKVKESGVEGVIKVREYVDMDALEDAIYHGKLNAAMLAEAQTKKEVVTLRISKAKKGKK